MCDASAFINYYICKALTSGMVIQVQLEQQGKNSAGIEHNVNMYVHIIVIK